MKNKMLSKRIAGWVERKAVQFAGARCPRQYHQPKIPQILKKVRSH